MPQRVPESLQEEDHLPLVMREQLEEPLPWTWTAQEQEQGEAP